MPFGEMLTVRDNGKENRRGTLSQLTDRGRVVLTGHAVRRP